ncbi:hypothetical protein TRFO_21438 [Tritrichomonas foetus]|uniref:TPR Domain containing protein n=1 Tax=Tritrichomonas foetus TaxID=1144522 RepID=A0A1J4KIH3_9EUKA|nr:hypothetical protein TRFO_21438 [Tritrichomonas foetus]|eukprot:OHT09628.1 hypothetical protein TRFO_21438 [Tritrichomonas foetus]
MILFFFAFTHEQQTIKLPQRYILVPNENDKKETFHFVEHCDFFHPDFRRTLFRRFKNLVKTSNLAAIKSMARSNFPPAQHFMAEYIQVNKNYSESFNLFQKAANNGYYESFSSLAFYLRYGFYNISENHLLSAVYTTIAAEKNSVRSMLTLANDYTCKFIRPQSYRSAVELLIKIDTAFCLCIEQSDCEQVTPNQISRTNQINSQTDFFQKGFEIIRYRANQGDKDALFELGNLYYSSNEVRNLTEALKIFKQLENIDKRAVSYLGRMYQLGQILEKNISQARKMYKNSSDEVTSMAGLGLLAMEKGNDEKAEKLLSLASQMGHLGAAFNLASIHYTKNKTQGIEEYLKLADSNFLLAQLNIASIFITDEEKSLRYLNKIAQKGIWNQPCSLAEEAFNSGDIEQALFTWLELGDMGNKVSAFNAGFILLKNAKKETFFGWSERKHLKVALRMFKISKKKIWEAETLMRLNKSRKCVECLESITQLNKKNSNDKNDIQKNDNSNNGRVEALYIQLMLNDQIPCSFVALRNNLTKIQDQDNQYLTSLFRMNIFMKLVEKLSNFYKLDKNDKDDIIMFIMVYKNSTLFLLLFLVFLYFIDKRIDYIFLHDEVHDNLS